MSPTNSKSITTEIEKILLEGLTDNQRIVVKSGKRRVLVVAGAGSGKTEVMARRVAWWVTKDGVSKDSIVAFTFTEAAAEELKFRIRQQFEKITPPGEDVTLGGMYVGTIHGFCLKQLRESCPDVYHNFDVIDEGARAVLVNRGFYNILGLKEFSEAWGTGTFQTVEEFLRSYDLLNEYAELDVKLPTSEAPHAIEEEADWCKKAKLKTKVGRGEAAKAFSVSAARYYAYLRCRRFLDFSTSQSEFVRLLESNKKILGQLRVKTTHLVVDEVQDINPVQGRIIEQIVGSKGHLTAVGDHRQAIYAWRGGRVEIMGNLFEKITRSADGEVVQLEENFRSTPRVIEIANQWSTSIGQVRSMKTTNMKHGNKPRVDKHNSHVAMVEFQSRDAEADWIAETIDLLVRRKDKTGAYHDSKKGERGLSYADISILKRSSTDARVYMLALEKRGIPAVFRAGPDLFSQPEVLLFVAALSRSAGIVQFYGNPADQRSLPGRINQVLGSGPDTEAVLAAAIKVLQKVGLPVDAVAQSRLLLATKLIDQRIQTGNGGKPSELKELKTPELRTWLAGKNAVRRIFPQALFHWLLSEAGVEKWDAAQGRGATAMFHLGQLSSLVKELETPGWTSAFAFKEQMAALDWWGAQNSRTEQSPLLVQPDAVTISTVHGAKGLEFGVVFLADVCSRRFPSSRARVVQRVPFNGPILKRIDISNLSDNTNLDQERRLMYVALTRAERYLFVTTSKPSPFYKELEPAVRSSGGVIAARPKDVVKNLNHRKTDYRRDIRLVTSFSDLRYYLACPHDFYLRKVLGFAPTIDQAFGYGRGIHNLLRAVHTDSKYWAGLADDPNKLKIRLEKLLQQGLFYLRYTTGEPAENMRKKAVRLVSEYVKTYHPELSQLLFEPEREFETLIPEEQVLVSGAIDVLRLDDPPRVTLIDFKSGEVDSEAAAKLDQDEMKLQVSLYGLAARKELEYEPERGLVRYLDEPDQSKRELVVNLDNNSLDSARKVVVDAAARIRERVFHEGPKKKASTDPTKVRCSECDFINICGMNEARTHRSTR